MKLALVATLATLSLAATSPPKPELARAAADKPIQLALACYKKGDRVSGQNRICTYSCSGQETVITIKATELCPLTIDR